jgi:putative membrane protein
MHAWSFGWGMTGFGMLFSWLLGILLLVALVLWIARLGQRGGSGAGETPEAVLKRRYARGEITREQYQRMLEDLRR